MCDVCSEGGEEGASSQQSSHKVSAMASVLADKMLESPEMRRWLEGDLSALNKKTVTAPKSVSVSRLLPLIVRPLARRLSCSDHMVP